MRSMMVSLVACSLLCATAFAGDKSSSPPIAADASPDATLTLKGGSVAAGIGFTWGHGELKYNDGTYKFAIKGVSIVDVGATDFTAAGHVYRLKQLADFAGNYVAADAGITVAGGGDGVYLKNEHGVIIKLVETNVGLKFSLAAEGVHITLKS
jgi:hypothetical protein